jgi:CRISPR/Cas system CMR subunit Cmr6 (Cas7 group RAMP superfamily)
MPDPHRPGPRPAPPPGRRPAPPRTPARRPAPPGPGQPDSIPAAGPFGATIFLERQGSAGDPYRLVSRIPFGTGNNPLVMLNRIAFFDERTGKLHDDGKRELVGWACRQNLGQDRGLVAGVARRREAALRALATGWPSRHYVRLIARPEWRLAVGLGNKANPYEIGLALHGTYGWPVIPGSALKGLAAAWAVASGADAADVWRVLGGTRADVPHPAVGPNRDERAAARGTVCFLDAIPAGEPVVVEADVLTPHVKPYYDGAAAGSPVPPAEYHNPVPVTFLTVRGDYAVDVYGSSPEDVELAAEWLAQAGDELGAGAKTAAGYGYLSVRRAARGGPA